MNDITTVAVVGTGGWGKNLVRNYHEIPAARLKYVCDLDQARLAEFASRMRDVTMTDDFQQVLGDPEIEAVVIATPAPTHFSLARQALEAGKDVYVEKPFTLDTADAETLISLAQDRQRILMVGHLLEYHPVVTRLKEMIDQDELGNVMYIYSQRLNLGTVREDENALWNFAPHDISTILFLLGKEPVKLSAQGQCYLQEGIEDVVFLTMYFADDTMAHIHVSWLDPHKTRKFTIVGAKKMAVFDDLDPTEKLRIYDKGARLNTSYNTFAEYLGLRFGDVTIPHMQIGEPLRAECNHFLECVRTRQQPLSDGADGLRVVKVLTAAQRSLEQNGEQILL